MVRFNEPLQTCVNHFFHKFKKQDISEISRTPVPPGLGIKTIRAVSIEEGMPLSTGCCYISVKASGHRYQGGKK